MTSIKNTLAALALAATTAGAQTTAITNVDNVSTYIARGMYFGPGVAVQPNAIVNHRSGNNDVTGILWGNFDPKQGFNEADLFLRTGHYIGPVHAELGFGKLWNTKNPTVPHTEEVSAHATVGPLNAFIAHDYNHVGDYAEASITLTIPGTPVVARGAIGYNNHYFAQGSGVSHLESKLTMPLTKNGITYTPFVQVIKGARDGFPDQHAYGISVTKTFEKK